MTIPKILVVDDDPGIRAQLKWGIEGFEVITADSREAALELLEEYHPPLVTLDLGLPPCEDGTQEGYAALKAILEKAPDTRVVVVSGSGEKENAELSRDRGAFEFHAKPVRLEKLQAIISSAYQDFRSSTR